MCVLCVEELALIDLLRTASTCICCIVVYTMTRSSCLLGALELNRGQHT